MGYHHCHVPSLNELENLFQKIGLEQFVKNYKNCETIIGNNDSIAFIESKILEYLQLSKSK